MVKIDTFVIKLKFKSNKLNILYIIKNRLPDRQYITLKS